MKTHQLFLTIFILVSFRNTAVISINKFLTRKPLRILIYNLINFQFLIFLKKKTDWYDQFGNNEYDFVVITAVI